jgi:hypothetical protein
MEGDKNRFLTLNILQIPFTQSHAFLVGNETIFWLLISLTTSWDGPISDLNMFPTKPSKTIGPPGKPEGNTTHRMYYVASPEIVLWVTAMLRCLQSRNEWGYGIVIDIS